MNLRNVPIVVPGKVFKPGIDFNRLKDMLAVTDNLLPTTLTLLDQMNINVVISPTTTNFSIVEINGEYHFNFSMNSFQQLQEEYQDQIDIPMVKIFKHESKHLEQLRSGRLALKMDHIVWEGRTYPYLEESDPNYKNQPWELEARRAEQEIQ